MPKSWTDGAPAPVVLQDHATLEDPLTYKIKRRFLGGALNRHSLGHQRLNKRYAYGILSSDCISSSAYGGEQILVALIPAFGLAALCWVTFLTFSLSQVILLSSILMKVKFFSIQNLFLCFFSNSSEMCLTPFDKIM